MRSQVILGNKSIDENTATAGAAVSMERSVGRQLLMLLLLPRLLLLRIPAHGTVALSGQSENSLMRQISRPSGSLSIGRQFIRLMTTFTIEGE